MRNLDKFIYSEGDIFELTSSKIQKHGTHDQSTHGNWASGGVSRGLTQSVLDRVKANGGLSVNMVDGSEPKSGYMVASPVKKAPIVDADDFYNPSKGRKILADFVKANKKDLGTGKKYLGLWHNKEDNKVYLDVSENVQDRAKAVRLGRERNQISIWDVVNFEEIGTGGTGVTEKRRSEDSGSTIEYVRDDRRTDRQLGEFSLRQVGEVEKHGTHDQSSHAGSRRRIGSDTGQAKPKQPQGEQEVTDPNAPKPKLKPGRKPDKSGTLEERAEKLARGERIEVTQKEAKQIMDIMSKRSDDPDLTNMHVSDTKLYDEDNLGIPRNKMPQVPSDTKAVFIGEMEKRGAKVVRGVADPSKLHPIQAEMSASKVGLIMKTLREKGTRTDDGGRIVISKDNYVIDGHHRWAAAAMLSFENPDIKLPVIKVDINHRDLIDATLAWNEATGIKPIGMGESNKPGQIRKWIEFDAIVAKAVRGRTIIRFQPGLKPTLKHLSGQHDQKTHGSWAGYSSETAEAMWGEKRAKALKQAEGIGPTEEEFREALSNRLLTKEEIAEIATYEKLEMLVENTESMYKQVLGKAIFTNAFSDWFRGWQEGKTPEQIAEVKNTENAFNAWMEDDPTTAQEIYDDALGRYISEKEEGLSEVILSEEGYELTPDGYTSGSELTSEFQEKVFEIYNYEKSVIMDDGTEDNLSTSLRRVERIGKNAILVVGDINSDNSGTIGEFRREFRFDKQNDEKLVVSHELLEIDSNWQNKGFGGGFIMQQENYYITHGFDKVFVHAALDEGGYAWAKAGFQWDLSNETNSKERIGQRIQFQLNDTTMDDATRGVLDDYRQRLYDGRNNNDPEPWEVAAVRDSAGNQVGKQIMEGSNWYGVKYLTPTGRENNVEQSDLARENSYTSWRLDDKVAYNVDTGEVKGQLELGQGA
jgi:hypothetical protein